MKDLCELMSSPPGYRLLKAAGMMDDDDRKPRRRNDRDYSASQFYNERTAQEVSRDRTQKPKKAKKSGKAGKRRVGRRARPRSGIPEAALA